MVSYIIPAYNAEKTLAACLDSVLSSNWESMEVLVVDDGSGDRTAAIAGEYASLDSRVKVISKPNGGVSTARNSGLTAAQGDKIVFVDSDDTIDAAALDRTLSHMSEDCDMVIAPMAINGENQSLEQEILSTADDKRAFLNRHITDTTVKMVWNKIYRKAAVNELRFDERIRYGEDTLYVLEAIGRSRKIAVSSDVWYHYNEPTDTGKYTGMDIADSIHSAQELRRAYHESGANVPEFETRVFLDYRRCCQSLIYGSPREWYGNEFVAGYYRDIRRRLPLMYRVVYGINSLPPVYTLRSLINKKNTR